MREEFGRVPVVERGAPIDLLVDGEVVLNILTPHMQQFLGRCVGAIKKAGIKAKGSGQFSVLLNDGQHEIHLTRFYKPEDDPELIQAVVGEARRLTS